MALETCRSSCTAAFALLLMDESILLQFLPLNAISSPWSLLSQLPRGFNSESSVFSGFSAHRTLTTRDILRLYHIFLPDA
jgi:hypothetical protein